MSNRDNHNLLQSFLKDRDIDTLSFKEKIKLINDNLHNIPSI